MVVAMVFMWCLSMHAVVDFIYSRPEAVNYVISCEEVYDIGLYIIIFVYRPFSVLRP